MHAAETTRALLLRSVPYGEADSVVTLLCERFGRLSCIARGARRSKRRFGGALSPLQVLSVEVRPGRGELWTLSSAQIARAGLRLLSDLDAMNAGFAGLELLRELTPEHEPDQAVFDVGCALLALLDEGGAPPAALEACFGLRLLSLAGMAPRLDRCGRCGRAPRPEQAVELDAAQGHLVCRACGGAAIRLAPGLRSRLVLAESARWPEAAREPFAPADLATVRRVLEASVEARLGRAPRRSRES